MDKTINNKNRTNKVEPCLNAGAENLFKNVAILKSNTGMGNIKQIFGIWFCTIIAVFVLTNCDGSKRKALNDPNTKEEYSKLIPNRDEKSGKWGYLNERGEIIIPFKYDGADDFMEGLAKVKLNEKYGCIDEKGKEIIPLIFERIDFLFDRLVKVKLDGQYGLFKKTGIEILPPIYTIIQKMNTDNFAYDIRAGYSNEWTHIDRNGIIKNHSLSSVFYVFAFEDIIYETVPETNNVNILEINGDYEVIIPDKVVFNGTNYKVEGIDRSLGCSDNISSITLPGSLNMGSGVLCNCKNLTTVTLSASRDATAIPFEAFKHNYNLTSINIPESVEYIGDEAFRGCVNLISIKIPNKVKRIGHGAFQNCTGLTEIIIPNSIKTIGDRAFSGCINLVSASIPETVTSFGNKVFEFCPKLTTNPMPLSALRRIWENTRRADRINEYNSFIRSYPHSEYVTIAQNRIEQLNAIKRATVELNCPSDVDFKSQATWNWNWTTRFTEKNDKAGYTLSSSTYSITKGNIVWYPPDGSNREITVNKGSGDNTSTSLSGEEMRGGTFKRVWNGKDEWGNPIEVIEKVILR